MSMGADDIEAAIARVQAEIESAATASSSSSSSSSASAPPQVDSDAAALLAEIARVKAELAKMASPPRQSAHAHAHAHNHAHAGTAHESSEQPASKRNKSRTASAVHAPLPQLPNHYASFVENSAELDLVRVARVLFDCARNLLKTLINAYPGPSHLHGISVAVCDRR
jgi:hypothetical protein